MSLIDHRKESITPCVDCNDRHAGVSDSFLGHAHTCVDGVGYIRLMAIGAPRSEKHGEFCWRCSCQKSGWVNVTNEISDHCDDKSCVCHTAERCA
jgi:hypothetical protein